MTSKGDPEVRGVSSDSASQAEDLGLDPVLSLGLRLPIRPLGVDSFIVPILLIHTLPLWQKHGGRKADQKEEEGPFFFPLLFSGVLPLDLPVSTHSNRSHL